MQATRQGAKLILLGFVVCLGCTKQKSFDKAIAEHRNTLVDQVNPVLSGAPFFTIKTLNPVWNVTEKTPIVESPEFNLVDQDGNKRDAGMFKGKVSIVGFMFASCKGFCPFLVESMKGVEQAIKDRSEPVQFVAITVDPSEDTPEVLKTYAAGHNLDTETRWSLLTGDQDTIYKLARETFASQVFKRQTEDPNFVHSEHLYVIDKGGRLRGILNGTRVDVGRDAQSLLAQLGP